MQTVEHGATQSRRRSRLCNDAGILICSLCVSVCACMCVCLCVCEVLARDSSCPLGFANVALPPLQQHGTVSVFVVELALCASVCVCVFVHVRWEERYPKRTNRRI